MVVGRGAADLSVGSDSARAAVPGPLAGRPRFSRPDKRVEAAAAATVDASALAVKGTQVGMPSKAGTEARASMGMDEETTEAQRANQRGKESSRQQRWEAAAREYTSAVNLSMLPRFQRPDWAAVYLNNRAVCYIRLQRFEEAVEDCEAALALNTDFWKAGERAGKALLMMGDFERALAHLEHAETAANTKFEETSTARRMLSHPSRELLTGPTPEPRRLMTMARRLTPPQVSRTPRSVYK